EAAWLPRRPEGEESWRCYRGRFRSWSGARAMKGRQGTDSPPRARRHPAGDLCIVPATPGSLLAIVRIVGRLQLLPLRALLADEEVVNSRHRNRSRCKKKVDFTVHERFLLSERKN